MAIPLLFHFRKTKTPLLRMSQGAFELEGNYIYIIPLISNL
jgi:hypothetical protein